MLSKLLKKTLKFSAIAALTVYSIDFIVTKGLRKSNSIHYDNFSKIFSGSMNADLLINGSSKGYVQFSPKILDSLLRTNSYNISLDGNNFLTQNTLITKYLQYNTKPQTIVQVVSTNTLKGFSNEIFLYEKFLPYFEDIEIRNMLNSSGKNTAQIVNYLPFTKYNGKPLALLEGVLSFFNLHLIQSPLYKGYREDDFIWTDENYAKFIELNNEINDTKEFKFDEELLVLFEEFIVMCNTQNINLILVYPPLYHLANNYGVQEYINLATKHNVTFFDFSHDSEISFDKKYFYDSQHMNKLGSEVFTVKLSKLILEGQHHFSN
tara:strand:- start:1859 stop:2821 length:963 start_codon:yes stop_codon:yes gene_type:complete